MKNLSFLLVFIIFVSCESDKEYTFFDVDNLNSQLKAEIGFDISLQKEKTDSVFRIDDQFYLNLIEQMSGGLNTNSFNRANFTKTPAGIVGNQILNTNEYDSIAQSMMQCFANNIIIQNCKNQQDDYLCKEKLRWYEFMSGDIGGFFYYGFFFPGLRDLHEKEYLSQKEFHYLILYLHYLGVLHNAALQ